MTSNSTKQKGQKKVEIETAISKARAWAEGRKIWRLSQSKSKGKVERTSKNKCTQQYDGSGKNRRLDALKEMLEDEEGNLFKINLKIEMIKAQMNVEENK